MSHISKLSKKLLVVIWQFFVLGEWIVIPIMLTEIWRLKELEDEGGGK